jgi:hypothetical protein
MKSTKYLLAMLGMVLALGLVLVGCGDKNSGDPTSSGGEPSTLTVNNAPKSGTVLICDSAVPTTLQEYTALSQHQLAMGNTGGPSSYKLGNTGGPFTQSGNFLVVLMLVSDSGLKTNIYFKGNVSFSKGSATVDFNDMTLSELF